MKLAALPPLFFFVVACGGEAAVDHPSTTPWIEPPSGAKDVASGSDLEKFFPMKDGIVYAYATLNEMNEQGALMARVHRVDATHGELVYPNGTKRFSYLPDGIQVELRTGPRYVLKAPLVSSNTWIGEHDGRSRVIAVNAQVETPAGKFNGCVQTLEERLGDAPVRYATTFCPDVGVVVIEAATGANLERAELKSFGEPEAVGPDGVTQMKVTPTPGP